MDKQTEETGGANEDITLDNETAKADANKEIEASNDVKNSGASAAPATKEEAAAEYIRKHNEMRETFKHAPRMTITITIGVSDFFDQGDLEIFRRGNIKYHEFFRRFLWNLRRYAFLQESDFLNDMETHDFRYEEQKELPITKDCPEGWTAYWGNGSDQNPNDLDVHIDADWVEKQFRYAEAENELSACYDKWVSLSRDINSSQLQHAIDPRTN